MFSTAVTCILIGFICGIFVTCYSYNTEKWKVYKPGDFVQFNVITVLYVNGDLFTTRDRNDIDWLLVRSYALL